MTTGIIGIDVVAALFFLLGLHMAFRQSVLRRLWSQLLKSPVAAPIDDPDDDPVRYALRIGGVMLMAFSGAIALLFTVFSQSGQL